MAKLKIFTIRDSKAEAYLNPFFMPTTGQAIRAFQTCANDPKHDFGIYPGDYTLFEIGEFEESTGIINQYESKTNLGLALEHIQPKHKSNIQTFVDQTTN